MVESVIPDKDASERNAISNFLKNTFLLLCFFHVVKTYGTGLKWTHNIKSEYLRSHLEAAKVKFFVKEQFWKIICDGIHNGRYLVRFTLSKEEIAGRIYILREFIVVITKLNWKRSWVV